MNHVECALHLFMADGRVLSYRRRGVDSYYASQYGRAAKAFFAKIPGVAKVNFWTGRWCGWPNGMDDGFKPPLPVLAQLPNFNKLDFRKEDWTERK